MADAVDIVADVLLAVVILLYLILVVYIAFALFALNHVALFLISLIGSFALPVVIPVIFLILLSSGVLEERVDTVFRATST